MYPNKHKLKVFLCHSSEDSLIIHELYRKLGTENWIDPWLDKTKILPGQNWVLAIEKAVEESDAVIICLSKNSVNKEGFIQRELRYASEIALEKPEETIFLIPCRLEECNVPKRIRSLQWTDYFGENKEEAYSILLKSLKIRHEQIIQIREEKESRRTSELVEEPNEYKNNENQHLIHDQIKNNAQEETQKGRGAKVIKQSQVAKEINIPSKIQDLEKAKKTSDTKPEQHLHEKITQKEVLQFKQFSIWNLGYTSSDITILLIIGGIAGAINIWMLNIWYAANMVSPIYGAALQGAFMWAYLLAYFLVRKPGSMLIIGIIETSVEALLGNQAGLSTLGWGISQGIGAEAVMFFVGYKKFNWIIFGLAGAVSSQASTLWSYALYGWSSTNDYLIALPINMVSGFFISGLGGYWLGKTIKRR